MYEQINMDKQMSWHSFLDYSPILWARESDWTHFDLGSLGNHLTIAIA